MSSAIFYYWLSRLTFLLALDLPNIPCFIIVFAAFVCIKEFNDDDCLFKVRCTGGIASFKRSGAINQTARTK